MTIRETISRIKKGVKEVNADSKLTSKYIYSAVVTKSGLLMQRESDALRLSNIQDTYQTLRCMRVEEIPAVDPRCKIKSAAKLFRTVACVPDMFFDSDGPIIRSLRSVDGFTDIQLLTEDSIKRWLKDPNSRYDKSTYAFYSNQHFYLTKKVPIKVEGAFISEVSHLDCNCDDIPCYSFLDTNWRVPKKLQDQIITLVIQDLANIYEKIPEKVQIDKNPNT